MQMEGQNERSFGLFRNVVLVQMLWFFRANAIVQESKEMPVWALRAKEIEVVGFCGSTLKLPVLYVHRPMVGLAAIEFGHDTCPLLN